MSREAENALVAIRQLPNDELAVEIANTALELAMAAKQEAAEDRKSLAAALKRIHELELILGTVD